MFLMLPLVLGFDMCKYYFNQRDWHMNQHCNLESELNMNANMTTDTFADYTAKYATKRAPVAVVTEFAEVREISKTCQIYLFGISGGTLQNGLIYFNATIDLSERKCSRVEFSPFGTVASRDGVKSSITNIIITGTVEIITSKNQTTIGVSKAFSYVIGNQNISGVKSNLKIKVNGVTNESAVGSFTNGIVINNATDADLEPYNLVQYTAPSEKIVKISKMTFGTDYEAVDFVQLAYQGMGAFTKMFANKAKKSSIFAFTTGVLMEQSRRLEQEVLVVVGNTETIAFNNTGFTVCSPYDGQYDVTSKKCLQNNARCSDMSVEGRMCLKIGQNCPSAYYKKDKMCCSSVDISQGQIANQHKIITTCGAGQKAFHDNTCKEESKCTSDFKRFGNNGCTLDCPQGNEESSGRCKIPGSANECTGKTAKYIQARANRPAMCLPECPSEYYEDGNQCKLTCDDQKVYDPVRKSCQNSCPTGYLKQERYCVKQCSSGHIKKNMECVTISTNIEQCPEGMFADVSMSLCVACGVLTNAYWKRNFTKYDKTKCFAQCDYYNISEYQQNKPTELFGKTKMFFCEEIKTNECKVYEQELGGTRKICKKMCNEPYKYINTKDDPKCVEKCATGYEATDGICAEACKTYFQEPDGTKTCRECTSDERRTTDSEGRTRCMKDCPNDAPYFDKDDKKCKDTCPVFHEQNFCLQACTTKLYETRDSKLFCIDTCPSPRFETVSTSYNGNRECVDKCPQATPYYIAESLTCITSCVSQNPYYDPVTRNCAAECSENYEIDRKLGTCIMSAKSTNKALIGAVVGVVLLIVIIIVIVSIVVVLRKKRAKNKVVHKIDSAEKGMINNQEDCLQTCYTTSNEHNIAQTAINVTQIPATKRVRIKLLQRINSGDNVITNEFVGDSTQEKDMSKLKLSTAKNSIQGPTQVQTRHLKKPKLSKNMKKQSAMPQLQPVQRKLRFVDQKGPSDLMPAIEDTQERPGSQLY